MAPKATRDHNGQTPHLVASSGLPSSPSKQDLLNTEFEKTFKGQPNVYQLAVKMFNLGQYGVEPTHVMAVIKNELATRDWKDEEQDNNVRKGKFTEVSDNETLGYSQISTKGLAGLRSKFSEFNQMLISSGYPNTADGNKSALVDPRMAPYIVAAKLASIADEYKHSPQRGIQITAKTIIYGYNADVYKLPLTENLCVGHQYKIFGKKVYPGNGLNHRICEAADLSNYVKGVFRYVSVKVDVPSRVVT